MDPQREAFLARLKQFGEENDRRAVGRTEKMLNITADTGLLFWMLTRAWQPRRILEVGTSNGYSTIWWADALTSSGQELITLENNPAKVALARSNFAQAGVAERIRVIEGDAGAFLHEAEAGSFDLVFLDSERSEYVAWWPDVLRVTTARGLIIVDNALDRAAELEEFVRAAQATPEVRLVLVPIGNGELLLQK
ncbi:MAG: O-methyltransferase [Thermaerobacter sp.]|nr:O-methyltransferase [Thermaerobacter sp.]